MAGIGDGDEPAVRDLPGVEVAVLHTGVRDDRGEVVAGVGAAPLDEVVEVGVEVLDGRTPNKLMITCNR
jgi:hypothetical protein